MTQEERERYINDHINNYKMSREEAEAVVDGMTDAEVEVARRHGIGRCKRTEPPHPQPSRRRPLSST